MCDRIDLQRLESIYYHQYLQYLSKKTWGKELSEATLNKITDLTECHPRRTYILCGKIWDVYSDADHPPSAIVVERLWHEYALNNVKEIRGGLKNLSKGQVKVLTLIAIGTISTLTGKEAQRVLDLSGSAISQAIDILLDRDYIELDDNKAYHVIDPVIKHILIHFGQENLLLSEY